MAVIKGNWRFIFTPGEPPTVVVLRPLTVVEYDMLADDALRATWEGKARILAQQIVTVTGMSVEDTTADGCVISRDLSFEKDKEEILRLLQTDFGRWCEMMTEANGRGQGRAEGNLPKLSGSEEVPPGESAG